jgi:hypothetical protein
VYTFLQNVDPEDCSAIWSAKEQDMKPEENGSMRNPNFPYERWIDNPGNKILLGVLVFLLIVIWLMWLGGAFN